MLGKDTILKMYSLFMVQTEASYKVFYCRKMAGFSALFTQEQLFQLRPHPSKQHG